MGVPGFRHEAVLRFQGVGKCDVGALSFGEAHSLGELTLGAGREKRPKILIDIAGRRVV
jgi:hypothetical protein